MPRPRLAALLLALSLAASPLPAAPNAAAPAAWTVDDLLLAERVEAMLLCPDGKLAVWVKSAMDAENGKRASNLFLSRLDGGTGAGPNEIQLTRGRDRNQDPRFSPDGQRIAFLSDRPRTEAKKGDGDNLARTQLWLLSLAGGEPWCATRLERDVVDYAWQDAGNLIFAAEEDPAFLERDRKEKKDTSQVVEDREHQPPVRLFRLDVESGKVRRLTENRDWIDLLEVSPDGRWAVTRNQQSLSFEYDNAVVPQTFLHDLSTGKATRILDGRLFPGSVAWQPDSRGFYFTADYSSHPQYLSATVAWLHHFDLAAGSNSGGQGQAPKSQALKSQQVALDWERGLAPGAPVLPTADGFLALLADGVYSKPARYTRAAGGWRRAFLEGEHARNLWNWAATADGGRLVYEHSQANRPPQWLAARVAGSRIEGAAQLTRLNRGYEGKPLPSAEIVRFPGARGDEVEGILHYPVDYKQGERRPLVLAIHGGPAAADHDAWNERISKPMLLLQQKGAFVLEVNYHGSSDYGLEWVESIAGHYYDLEIPDLEAGVDHLVARGLVDLKRLGTMGWSNGGILSAELITRSPRYRAASIGAADVEWISDWGNVDFGASFDNYYFGASPLDDPETYVRKSPFFRLGEVRTPTIVYTGTEDRNVPPSQSWSLFRALQQLGKVPVKLVLFPGEPHGLGQLAHQRRKVEEDLAWFDRYLFGAAPPASEALKPGSALDRLLARDRAARAGGRLGVKLAGILAPEIVPFRGLKIGRFEVTRAQYAAFEPKYEFLAGTDDYPVTGLDAEQAQRYTAWLSDRLKVTFRLPKESEVASFLEGAERGNTLDHWAGYPPTPAEAEALRFETRNLPVFAPLLSEAGRFDATGEPPVFDLGGNAAEWVIGADGKGKLLGGSADRPADPKGSGEAGEAYRGFRVVLDSPASPPPT